MNNDWITDRPPTVDEVPDCEYCWTTEHNGSLNFLTGSEVRESWQAEGYATIAWMMPPKPYVPPTPEPDTSLAASIERYHSWKRDSAPVRPDLISYITSGLHDADFNRIIEAARKWNAANDPNTSLAECGAHCVLDTYGIKTGLIHDRVVLLGIKLDAVAKERDELKTLVMLSEKHAKKLIEERDELKCMLQSEALSCRATIREEYRKREAAKERDELRARIAELELENERVSRVHPSDSDRTITDSQEPDRSEDNGSIDRVADASTDSKFPAEFWRLKYRDQTARAGELIEQIRELKARIAELELEVERHKARTHRDHDDMVMLSNLMECKCTEPGYDNRLFAVMARKYESLKARIAETQPTNEAIAEVAAALDAWADSPAAGLMAVIMRNMAKKLRGKQ